MDGWIPVYFLVLWFLSNFFILFFSATLSLCSLCISSSIPFSFRFSFTSFPRSLLSHATP